ncbi:MAG: hypothetical protein IPP73_17370 [Chitinophagaceae bacterium]|nr:hypothetical protein [Chitinophagaceae bacterium]
MAMSLDVAGIGPPAEFTRPEECKTGTASRRWQKAVPNQTAPQTQVDAGKLLN